MVWTGFFMQRFFSNLKSHDKESLTILKNALEAASKNERAIGVMYYLSGLRAKREDCSVLIEDWKFL